ncbi:hypothetical protein AM500_10555 [Bacillus sp. FJAT-18017]|uniref:DMT family transporter n=1 Tax=Bacillus sp. FJAT-18017 TaxID=1705566 RepID=UPI0006AE0A12|nr:DMT family transporter [Bacillus sp. FJAT-18017]ALC90175.1 hypothetical protein AM500_10555 [Bacillus sp. FJAT-18017]
MNKQLLADGTLILVAFIWGTTFVLVQNAISFLEPFSFNGVRFMAAALVLGLWLILFERKQLKQLNKNIIFAGFLLGVFLFIGYAAQTAGLLYTTSSKAGFITGLSVVLVPMFSFLLMKQQPSRNAILGVIIATIGLFLLTMGGVAGLNKGDALVFICAIGFALQIILTGKYSRSFPSLLLTVIQIGTVGILSTGSAFIFEDWGNAFKPDILLSTEVLLALIICSLFATAFAFLVQTSLQKHTSPTRVALIFAMEPVFAAGAGYFWANETLTLSALIGCLLIFAGMIFSELPSKSARRLGQQATLDYSAEKPGA